jgi:enhancing lycopene biosynthesis protein 2
VDAIDALIVPGGEGPIATLSDYPAKHALCQVHPDVAQLLRAMLQTRRPDGVLRSVGAAGGARAGAGGGRARDRGPKGTPAAKHAAVMGADVRPCAPEDVIVDQKARVYSTPGSCPRGRACPASRARSIDGASPGSPNARDRAPTAPPPDDFDVTGVTTDRGRGSA